MKSIILTTMLIASDFIVFSQYIPPYIPQEGLIAWYPFNGNSDDESGNDNNGTVTGAVLSPDRIGSNNSAYYFDKNNVQMITVAGSPGMNAVTSLTLSMWIKIATYGVPGYNGWNQFVNKWTAGTYHYIFANNNQGLYFYYSTEGYYQSYVLPPLNSWCHVAVTYNYSGNPDDSWCHFYIDGQKVDSFSTYQALTPTDCGTEIGGFNNDVLSTVDGNMDDIGIWNRALTSEEISDVYEAYSLGMNESKGNTRFQVYPNPAQDHLIIQSDRMSPAAYAILDGTGRIVLNGQLVFGPNRLIVDHLPPGLYFLEIKGETKIKFAKL